MQGIHHIAPIHLLRLAKGFSRIFWGIPLSLFLFVDILQIKIANFIQIPSCAAGALLVYWGLATLHATGHLSRSWLRKVRWTMFAVFLLIYFAPFVYWWQRQPYSSYYLANLAILLLTSVWLLFLINQLAGEAGFLLGDKNFRVEARLCAWSAVLCMAVPIIILIFYSFKAAIHQQEATLYFGLTYIQHDLPRWLMAFFLLPFTLTLVCAWRIKEICLAMLAQSARE